MQLVLMRHAKASSEDYQGDDASRPLSKEGVSAHYLFCKRLKETNVYPSFIFHSPFLRARQTAEIVAEQFEVNCLEVDSLGASFNEDQVLDLIKTHMAKTPISAHTFFLIGHEPSLLQFAYHLIKNHGNLPTGLASSSALIIEFDTPPQFGKGCYRTYLHL